MFQSKDSTCKIDEVKISIPQYQPADELSGAGKTFDWLYRLGFAVMSEALSKFSKRALSDEDGPLAAKMKF